MSKDVWVLGGTGRTGRAISRRLAEAGLPVVVVGRDAERLATVADGLPGTPRPVVASWESTLARLAAEAPAVVINTVGPFATSALPVARACPPGTHYVDVANELPAVEQILRLDRRAEAAGQVLVTGAGFGVLATESVVLRLCAGEPRPASVRVDALAEVAIKPGVVGTALAQTIVGVLALGGREVRGGRLVRSRVAAHPIRLTTPDGAVIATAGGANGELLAAWRASEADAVVAASSAAPSGAVARTVLPAVVGVCRLPAAGPVAARLIARVPLRPHAAVRPSWAHARVEWRDAVVREGWLRTGDAMDFTAAVATEVATRLLRGQGRPGAYTSGAIFGPELAESAGGAFVPG